jgi:hypothetical protein
MTIPAISPALTEFNSVPGLVPDNSVILGSVDVDVAVDELLLEEVDIVVAVEVILDIYVAVGDDNGPDAGRLFSSPIILK